MAQTQSTATALRISKVFPWHYQLLFMVIEPGSMLMAQGLNIADPPAFMDSCAPSSTTSGPLFTFTSSHAICSSVAAFNTPQLRAMWHLLIVMWLFSAIIEPLVLYTARFKFHDARDTEEVVKAVLIAFTALDLLHMGAVLAVTGLDPALPWSRRASSDTMLHVWIPPAFAALRGLWLLGVGRDVTPRPKKE